MKKFLTVLLVIAVMFTFSFSSAFAAYSIESGNYTYAQAISAIEASAQHYIDAAAVEYNTATKAPKDALGYTVSFDTQLASVATATIDAISKEARNSVYEDSYNDYVIGVKKNLSKALAAFAAAADPEDDSIASTTIDDYFVDTFNTGVTPVTAWVAPVTTSDVDNSNAFLEAEFDVVKKETLENLSALAVTLAADYDDKTEITTGKTSYDVAVENVEAAIDVVEGYEYVTLTAADNGSSVTNAKLTQNLAMIKNMSLIYVPAVGSGDPSGLIYTATYNNTATDNLYQIDGVAFGLTAKLKGLSGLTELDPLTDAAKLSFAKSNVLAKVTADLAAAKKDAVAAITEDIITETAKGAKANQVVIDSLNEDLANVNDYYDRAVEVVTYIINNAETVAELVGGAYTSTGSWAAASFSDTGAADDVDFGNVTVTIPSVVELYTAHHYAGTYTAKVSDLVSISKEVAKAKEDAAALKAQILIDGTSYADIDALLKDAIDDIYRGKACEFKATQTTDARDYVFHYVEGTLIDTEEDEVTIAGVDYDNIYSWLAALGLYDEEKKDDVKAVVKEAKAAVRAAKTVEEADAAFLAAYAKFDAIPTAAEHKADFKYSTGANSAKYEAVKKELSAYAKAKIASLTELKTLKYYGTADLATLVAYYNTTSGGAFYNECFTAEELDAMLVEAKALVDGLKTEAELDKEGAAILAEVPAIAKATLADKDVVLAAYAKYVDFNDYCGLVDSAEKIYSHKLETLVRELEQVEAKAINDAYTAIMKDNKVTVDEADAVKALRAAFDAYQKSWVDEEIVGATGLIAATSLAVDANDVATVETALDNAQADAVVKMIGELPAEPTAEQVKAVRTAFNELTRTAQDRVFHANGGVTYSKFVDAEKLTVMDAEAAKAYVQDLSIKARSTKTSKGVKVTIKADVQELLDNGYTVEYKFYRSTKSNKGFKAMITKTTGTYTNTKGVKGTKYYYKAKLVVKNAEGEVVATTPLTQCLYATRTF